MTTIIIYRISQTNNGTFGVMVDGNSKVPLFVTAERPWNENKPIISCIPDGIYTSKKSAHPKHGYVYELMNVPNRSAILIHVGNNPLIDCEGCILIGESFGFNYRILKSKDAFTMFMEMYKHEEEIIFNIRTWYEKYNTKS